MTAVMLPPVHLHAGPPVLRGAVVPTVRSEFLERHAESLSTHAIFLNTAMAQVRSVPLISMSWTACPVEVRTAMRADARRMISSANNSLQQVKQERQLMFVFRMQILEETYLETVESPAMEAISHVV